MQKNNILLNILKKDTDFKTSIIISIIIYKMETKKEIKLNQLISLCIHMFKKSQLVFTSIPSNKRSINTL